MVVGLKPDDTTYVSVGSVSVAVHWKVFELAR